MKATITKPDGTKLKIEGEQVCRETSPNRCYSLPSKIIRLLVHRAWHRGWKVDIHEAGRPTG